MVEAVLTTIRANSLTEGYVRLIVTRGKGSLGLSPKTCPNPSVIVIASEHHSLRRREIRNRGSNLVTCATRAADSGITQPDGEVPELS